MRLVELLEVKPYKSLNITDVENQAHVENVTQWHISQYNLTYLCRSHVQSGTVCSTFNFVLFLRHISSGVTGSGPTICTVRVTRRTAVCV